jgi:hypothetical protein
MRIAARNAKNTRLDDVHYRVSEQLMVREVPTTPTIPDRIPRIRPPNRTPERGRPRPRGRDSPARNPSRATSRRAKRHAEKHNDRPKPRSGERTQPTAQAVGQNPKTIQLRRSERTLAIHPRTRSRTRKRRIQPAEAAIPGAMAGNWRDLHAVFEFAGISEPNKEAPVTREHNRSGRPDLKTCLRSTNI